tara:strand:- start:32241 stop:33491 length:1251 start_codon:yes stop_codon:yes gene_type:complete
MPKHETLVDRRRFWRIVGAGASFQGATAAVDSATVVASIVHLLTGSVFAVGFASSVLRLGWLLPQLMVGYLAERADRRMPFYVFGAYGRATCATLIAILLWVGEEWSGAALATGFLVLWTAYAFTSGVVGVPYNDIVGRSIPSEARSRMLAWRFFVGGLLAMVVAAILRLALGVMPELNAYALIFALGAALMVISSTFFVSAGEPPVRRGTTELKSRQSAVVFLKGGWVTLASDARFRLFLYSQWLGGATFMALPFYVIAATGRGIDTVEIATLLGAQTAGSLSSNAVWGWLGDHAGKLRLLQVVTIVRVLPPLAVLALLETDANLWGFVALFFVIGSMMNGVTIGFLGYLMEISPNDRRPAYSAYFNTLASPAALSPLLGAVLISQISTEAVFVAAAAAAVLQLLMLNRIATQKS